jgi:diguanylate cyclase (GGDEF)-like protein
MVAGYTSVPGIGWGVMVPQPLKEVERQVNTLMQSHTRWMFTGVVLAILIGLLLVRWITRPLNRLVVATDTLLKTNFAADLPPLSRYAPKETEKLYNAMHALLNGFRKIQAENQSIQENLQQRIEDATTKLLESNSRLEQLALCDHLTTLPNRRQFESVLRNSLNRRTTDRQNICLMLIDIDYFKNINDCYGHAAGDHVIRQIASILNSAMRMGDLVARYGGDEFAAELHCDEDTCYERAEQIRREIENTVFEWNDTHITTTVSIGLAQCDVSEEANIDVLLHEVDTSMYEAKKRGRNQIHHIGPEPKN